VPELLAGLRVERVEVSNEVVTYITPLTMIGEVSMDSRMSVWKIHATFSFLMLAVVIWSAGWNRVWA